MYADVLNDDWGGREGEREAERGGGREEGEKSGEAPQAKIFVVIEKKNIGSAFWLVLAPFRVWTYSTS